MSESLHVLHVITSLSNSQGGPAVALPLIAKALVQTGVEVTIVTTDDDGPGKRLHVALRKPIIGEEGATYLYFPKQTEFYRLSWPLTRWLWRHVMDFDLMHIHALFTYTSTAASLIAYARGVPYIVRPLGVLNYWGMQNRRRRLKSFSMRAIELPILRRAARIHYTSKQEQHEAAATGAGELPSVIVPLGVDTSSLSTLPNTNSFQARFPMIAGRSVILFLSRIDAKKGLDLLLPAFADVHRKYPASLLVIAGDGDPAYVAALRAEAVSLGLSGDHVIWTGFLTGSEKRAALAAATIFVLPSYSESFGIAAAEAFVAGIPCVLTDQVAISADAADTNSAIVIHCDRNALADAIVKLLTNKLLRVELSLNAVRLANERFSLAACGKSLTQLYSEIKSPERTRRF